MDGAAGLARLSPRERELVTLVGQGRTDTQIAAQLYITVRTVGSHLDRIRDKTGCPAPRRPHPAGPQCRPVWPYGQLIFEDAPAALGR